MRPSTATALFLSGSLTLTGMLTAAHAQSAGSVSPQTTAPGTPLETPDNRSPSGGTVTPTPTVPSGNLSSTLSRTNGVITPPSQVDPGMTTPTPSTGRQSTPVIPPPGSPGGNPSVTPK